MTSRPVRSCWRWRWVARSAPRPCGRTPERRCSASSRSSPDAVPGGRCYSAPQGGQGVTARPKNAEWLALTREAPLEPELPICDPHHHLWDKRPREVAERYLLDEILDDVDGSHNVVSTVFVECGAMYRADGPGPLRPVGETEFVDGIAAMAASGLYGPARVAAGIVGTADLRLGDAVGEVLDAHLAAGGGRFRGIRQMAAWDPDPALPVPRGDPGAGLLQRPEFRAGYRHLAPRQLTFEAWVYHPQLPDVTALARAFPDTTIVLEHFGGSVGIGSYAGRSQQLYAEWLRASTGCRALMTEDDGAAVAAARASRRA
ncbi:MAG: amidohydrolase family protein [Chloroflexi bacterium]|nr:amidohydrolase family protein [Chloroflexota bacterium]